MKKDSYKLNSDINLVCSNCGDKALRLPENNKKKRMLVSTFHFGICNVCGIKKAVTEVRDFGYPIFEVKE